MNPASNRGKYSERTEGILFWLDKISDAAIARLFHVSRQRVSEIRARKQRQA